MELYGPISYLYRELMQKSIYHSIYSFIPSLSLKLYWCLHNTRIKIAVHYQISKLGGFNGCLSSCGRLLSNVELRRIKHIYMLIFVAKRLIDAIGLQCERLRTLFVIANGELIVDQ